MPQGSNENPSNFKAVSQPPDTRTCIPMTFQENKEKSWCRANSKFCGSCFCCSIPLMPKPCFSRHRSKCRRNNREKKQPGDKREQIHLLGSRPLESSQNRNPKSTSDQKKSEPGPQHIPPSACHDRRKVPTDVKVETPGLPNDKLGS